MDVSVYIIDQNSSSEAEAAKLKQAGINMYRPSDNHAAFYSNYDNAFENFHAISAANAIVVPALTASNMLAILYALLKQKPIIFTQTITYDKHIDNFARSVIGACRSQFYIQNINALDEAELRLFLTNVAKKPINYALPRYQLALIKARMRAFFDDTIHTT